MTQSKTASERGLAPANGLLRWMARLAFKVAVLTVSFDLFLTIEVGFTLRISQVLWLTSMAVAAIWILMRGSLRRPLGLELLLAWTLFVVLFIPNSIFHLRGASYAALLLYNVSLVIATVELFRNARRLHQLLRWYLLSFVLVSLFGILQFAFPLVGLPGPLVQQWWIPGLLPRVNAFSFEPSYFATYLLTGWVLMAHLLLSRSRLIRPRYYLYIMFAVATTALVLSSSRMGLAMMALYFAYFPIMALWRLVKAKANLRYLTYTMFGMLAATSILLAVVATGTSRLLLTGTGVAGTPSHSTDIRFREFQDTLAVFSQSPLVGYSLGGVAPAIARLRGNPVESLADAQNNEGMSVFAEVLAASGVVGFLPFFAYMALLVVAPLHLARNAASAEHRHALTGLVVSFAFLLLILQMNQNVLRPYFWLHIAILSAYYAMVQREPKRVEPIQ